MEEGMYPSFFKILFYFLTKISPNSVFWLSRFQIWDERREELIIYVTFCYYCALTAIKLLHGWGVLGLYVAWEEDYRDYFGLKSILSPPLHVFQVKKII